MTEPGAAAQPWVPLPQTAEVLRELARFGEVALGPRLHSMADRVRAVVPELVGLSLAVAAEGVTLTVVSSVEQLAALDAVQYVDGGPCVAAVDRGETLDVSMPDLLDEGGWQLYARASAAVGIASSLSMPVIEQGRVVGGANLYASTPDAFEGRHEQVAEALGSDATLAVANADLSFRTLAVAAEAPERLRESDDVNIALGMIAASQDVGIDVARDRLRDAALRAGVTDAQAARAIMHIRIL